MPRRRGGQAGVFSVDVLDIVRLSVKGEGGADLCHCQKPKSKIQNSNF